jgi:hypothetical protein
LTGSPLESLSRQISTVSPADVATISPYSENRSYGDTVVLCHAVAASAEPANNNAHANAAVVQHANWQTRKPPTLASALSVATGDSPPIDQ